MDVYDGYTYLQQTFPTLPYVISHGILPTGMKAVMFGEQKKGKSLTMNQLAVAISHGMDWFGFKTNHKRILYMNFEVGHSPWQYRLKRYCKGVGVALAPRPHEFCMVSDLKGLRLDTLVGQVEMRNWIRFIIQKLYSLTRLRR